MRTESSRCCAVNIQSLVARYLTSLACMQNSPFLELMGNAVYLGKVYSDYAPVLQSYSPPLPFLLQHLSSCACHTL